MVYSLSNWFFSTCKFFHQREIKLNAFFEFLYLYHKNIISLFEFFLFIFNIKRIRAILRRNIFCYNIFSFFMILNARSASFTLKECSSFTFACLNNWFASRYLWRSQKLFWHIMQRNILRLILMTIFIKFRWIF